MRPFRPVVAVLAALVLAAGCQGDPAAPREQAARVSHTTTTPAQEPEAGSKDRVPRATPTRAAYVADPQPVEAAPGAPNVVLILTDDMRWDELAYLPKTQRLLGDQGMTFRNAISPHPLCCPARAEILTGAYAQNNGVYDNAGPMGRYPAYVKAGDLKHSIGPWFRRAGYDTGFIGKHINKYETEPGPPRDPGWTYWNPLTWGVIRYDDFAFWDGTTYRDDYVTTRIREKTTEALTSFAGTGRPFFLELNHVAPHFRRVGQGQAPPLVEPRYAELFTDQRSPSLSSPAFNKRRPGTRNERVDPGVVQDFFLARIRALQSVDDAVEDLMDRLREQGVLDNTYVIFTSDNGYDLGEHQHLGKNRLNNVDLRVPLLIRGPGIEPGSSSPRAATTVDLAATMIEMVGAEPTRPLDGLDLMPTLRGGAQRWRSATLIQTGSRFHNLDGDYWRTRGLLTRRYLLSRDYAKPRESVLYDHRRDPHELHSVYDDPRYRAVRRTLLRQLDKLIACRGVRSCNRQLGRVPRPRG